MNIPQIIIKRTASDVPTVEVEESRLVEVTNDVFHLEAQRKLSKGSDLRDKAFFLPDEYDWLLVKDNRGKLCLVQLSRPETTTAQALSKAGVDTLPLIDRTGVSTGTALFDEEYVPRHVAHV